MNPADPQVRKYVSWVYKISILRSFIPCTQFAVIKHINEL